MRVQQRARPPRGIYHMTKFWSPNGKNYYNVDHIVSITEQRLVNGHRELLIRLSDRQTIHVSLEKNETITDAIKEILEGTIYTNG
jgi:hypothetical protein